MLLLLLYLLEGGLHHIVGLPAKFHPTSITERSVLTIKQVDQMNLKCAWSMESSDHSSVSIASSTFVRHVLCLGHIKATTSARLVKS